MKALSRRVTGEPGSLAAGTLLGPYRITGLIGRGGMGEVYRAHDSRLPREVALKVLRGAEADDPVRLERFERESQAASALQHPAIVTVFEVGRAAVAGGPTLPFIAMELVDGRSLDLVLLDGRLGIRRCLELGAALAEGLAHAHAAGIIHRDFKPSNVVLTSEGRPKILDFGLAKLQPGVAADTRETLTSDGVVLGTVGYMSPEQARGERVTPASDQFAFGCVLYEMLTGRRAFQRPSPAETLSSILRDEPPSLEDSPTPVPVPLRWLVERCLAKDPQARYASTQDLARDLQTLRDRHADLASSQAIVERPPRRWGRLGAAAAALLLAGLGLWRVSRSLAPAALEPEFRLLTFRSGYVSRALFVPHSNAIVYTASWEGQAMRTFQTLPESVGFDRNLDAGVQLPLAYNQDGSQLLVLLGVARASFNVEGTLAWWPALGGRPRPILEKVGWADWAPRGRFLVAVRDQGSERVLDVHDESGKRLRTLYRTTGGIAGVRVSPDESRVAFIHHPSLYEASGEVRVAQLDGSGERAITPVFQWCLGLDWNRATGEVWFGGSRTALSNGLWAVGRGAPRLVLSLAGIHALQGLSADGRQALVLRESHQSDVAVRRGNEPPRLLTWFSFSVANDISSDGRTLLFYDGGAAETTWGTWMRPIEGGEALRLGDGGPQSRFAPDGRSVVTVVSRSGGPGQIVLIPVGAGERRQLTSPPASHESPSFAGPNTLLFVRQESGRREVWRMETDGSDARVLASNCDLPAAAPSGRLFVCVVADDPRQLVLHSLGGDQGRAIYRGPEGVRLRYARWNASGDQLFVVASDRRWLRLDSRSGRVLAEESWPYPGASVYDSLIGAALSADGRLQAYSVDVRGSVLYLVSGLL